MTTTKNERLPRYFRVCPRGFINEIDYIRADSDEDRREINRHFAGYKDRMFDEGEPHAFCGWITRPPVGYAALPWREYKALLML